MFLLFSMMLVRVFSLQIVSGEEYQENFVMKIERTLSKEAPRGNIYDCNGKLLAYNELAYSVIITDNGSYRNDRVKAETINPKLAEIVQMLERNGDSLNNEFKIDLNEDGSYSFNVSGNKLKRFLADVFGESSYANLSYNKDYGFNEAEATAEEVMTFLKGSFYIDEEYDESTAYKIVCIRFAMKSTSYTRFQPTLIAQNISEKTLAYINEHSDRLEGIDIQEDMIRKYNDSLYFASMIGYTGKISDSEYDKLSAIDKSYTMNDTVGKAGLEQYYESYLRGDNGEQIVYVDTVGRIQDVASSTEPVAGCDLYLSIDAEVQKNTYLLLEQEIAGIVYSNITSGGISINDVYVALLNNNVIDITQFDNEDATATEQQVYQSFVIQKEQAMNELKEQLYAPYPLTNNQMSEELLDYVTYIIDLLKSEGFLVTSKIDSSDSVYTTWRDGNLSPKDYLSYCIAKQWIDISLLDVDSKYADTTEIYDALVNFILTEADTDKEFAEYVYTYMVPKNEVTGKQLCLLLYEQGVLDYDESIYQRLQNGSLLPYDFLLDKINNIEITPAQLALDPCSGSCVITDVNTGEIKALVSYPGYDNNRLANGVDAEYYAKLNDDNSNPQWNYATQERTAPGSTFKMISSIAGLSEDVISTTSEIQCTGIFEEVDNKPKCHMYPNNHGYDNVTEALRDSCNVFYYTVGYKLSFLETDVYDADVGVKYINKYASIFGLNEKTGLEIAESQSQVADEYPVMAAIGQSNNNITTAALSRYVTAISTGKLYDYQLMNKIVDKKGNVVVAYEPEYKDVSNILSANEWNAIRTGMNWMTRTYDVLSNFPLDFAGKTGTAQQVSTRPNHALFVAYAPYEAPEISIATRIAYGYAASNAAAASRNILAAYFGIQSADEILALKAAGVNSSSSNIVTD
ncbi:MAG: peptidoglycan glycosyltransferase [Agathobacter sp.]|nr:peptidoglycan glycosyltransferase [Agathobacter sp.]